MREQKRFGRRAVKMGSGNALCGFFELKQSTQKGELIDKTGRWPVLRKWSCGLPYKLVRSLQNV
jgi:hypothetical protein